MLNRSAYPSDSSIVCVACITVTVWSMLLSDWVISSLLSSHHSVEVHQEHSENHQVHENGGRCQVRSCWKAAEASQSLRHWRSRYVHLASMWSLTWHECDLMVFFYIFLTLDFLSALQPCTRRPTSKWRRTRPPSIWSLVCLLTVDSVAPSTLAWQRPLRARSPAWPLLARRSWWSMWETSWEACCTSTNRNGTSWSFIFYNPDERHESGPVLSFTEQLFSCCGRNLWYLACVLVLKGSEKRTAECNLVEFIVFLLSMLVMATCIVAIYNFSNNLIMVKFITVILCWLF